MLLPMKMDSATCFGEIKLLSCLKLNMLSKEQPLWVGGGGGDTIHLWDLQESPSGMLCNRNTCPKTASLLELQVTQCSPQKNLGSGKGEQISS